MRDEPAATTGTLTTTSAPPARRLLSSSGRRVIFLRVLCSSQAAAALGWLKTRAPFQGHRRKRGEEAALSHRTLSELSPSRLMLAEKERPLPSFSEAVAAGGSLFLDCTLPLPSPGPELWAPDARGLAGASSSDRSRPWLRSRAHRRGPSPFLGPGVGGPRARVAHCCLSTLLF